MFTSVPPVPCGVGPEPPEVRIRKLSKEVWRWLISPLGFYVFAEASELASAWRILLILSCGSIRTSSVNLSGLVAIVTILTAAATGPLTRSQRSLLQIWRPLGLCNGNVTVWFPMNNSREFVSSRKQTEPHAEYGRRHLPALMLQGVAGLCEETHLCGT